MIRRIDVFLSSKRNVAIWLVGCLGLASVYAFVVVTATTHAADVAAATARASAAHSLMEHRRAVWANHLRREAWNRAHPEIIAQRKAAAKARADAEARAESARKEAERAQAAREQAAQRAQEAAAERAREAAATVLNITGSGIHTTETFQVNDEWALAWSYDCSNFENSGNFIVNVEGDGSGYDAGVNELGSSNSGTEYFHHGGSVYLTINSECDWAVKAVNE